MEQIRIIQGELSMNLNLALSLLPNSSNADLSKLRVDASALSDYLNALISNAKSEFKPIHVIKLLAGVTLSYGIYKTVGIYLTRRKYRHIPGPEASGYSILYLPFWNICAFMFVKDAFRIISLIKIEYSVTSLEI